MTCAFRPYHTQDSRSFLLSTFVVSTVLLRSFQFFILPPLPCLLRFNLFMFRLYHGRNSNLVRVIFIPFYSPLFSHVVLFFVSHGFALTLFPTSEHIPTPFARTDSICVPISSVTLKTRALHGGVAQRSPHFIDPMLVGKVHHDPNRHRDKSSLNCFHRSSRLPAQFGRGKVQT